MESEPAAMCDRCSFPKALLPTPDDDKTSNACSAVFTRSDEGYFFRTDEYIPDPTLQDFP